MTSAEWDALLERNSDLDGSPCELAEWSQVDLLALINAAEAELTRQNAIDAVQAIESIGSALQPAGDA